ncbi:M48 family metallopeptidase [Aquirhabdus sp.]|uniref:M48 family metallopeptidase n=1 Tax=Aquirhabdus sp. TaxID=2824160 RepID=UPI00396CE59F
MHMTLALCLAGLTGCSSTTQLGATGVDRRQFMLVSSDEINAASSQQYQQIIAEARQKGVLDTNAAQVQRLRNIANRLIAQTPRFRPDVKNWQWEVHLVNSDQLNASCMPGGKILFYTGIINRLNLTDDEIAAIMGHEMSHALREHGREQASRDMAQGLGLGILAAAVGLSDGATQAVGMAAQVGLDLPHSRAQEAEADTLGLELMARAGYNPQSALSLWQKMGAASTSAPPKFLSTHPPTAERYAHIQALLPRVMPLYQATLNPGRRYG